MRVIKQALWIIAFVVVTFFWMVAFQHGFTLSAVSSGAKEEMQTLFTQFSKKK
jgi:hypothetical protein